MDEFFTRAQLAYHRSQRLAREAKTCTDPARLDAINTEMDIIIRNLEEIREEQLVAQLERSKPKPKRRWWRRRAS